MDEGIDKYTDDTDSNFITIYKVKDNQESPLMNLLY